jgi:excisionase family DNA binding protein
MTTLTENQIGTGEIIPATTTGPATEQKLPKLALRIPEAAQVLNASTETVRRLLRRGKLRALASCRHKLIPMAEIERFLSADL